MQSVVFLVFAGLMLATVKGRNSFHDATDILRLTLNDSSAIFTTMETASAQMAAQSAALDGGFATLTDCPSGAACGACRWPGNTAPTTKAQWEQQQHDVLVGAGGEGGAAKGMQTDLALFTDCSSQLKSRLGGTAGQLRDVERVVGEDGKKYIDAVFAAMVAPGVIVLLLGLLSTWCLHGEKTGNTAGGCPLSRVLMISANVLGVAYVSRCCSR